MKKFFTILSCFWLLGSKTSDVNNHDKEMLWKISQDKNVQIKIEPLNHGSKITITSKDPAKVPLIKIAVKKYFQAEKDFEELGGLVKKGTWEKRMDEVRHGMIRAWNRNPIQPSKESVALGKSLYTQYCSTCHGSKGRGDGPAAKTLDQKPANLYALAKKFPDRYFFMQISYGKGSMPAWQDTFNWDERWHLTNYIRSLD